MHGHPPAPLPAADGEPPAAPGIEAAKRYRLLTSNIVYDFMPGASLWLSA